MEEYKVLDCGFVRLVDKMGDDSSVVQGARVSYGTGTKTLNKDKGLIEYLWKNRHTSPFEMCEIKLHIKCPIFIARQWLRHRTANVNEYSGRYSVMRGDYYVPDKICTQSTLNKQASAEQIDSEIEERMRSDILKVSEYALGLYHEYLAQGVSRETCRILLPINFYTEFYWKIDLHNLLHFLKLRNHDHAQSEIRSYAEIILEKIVKPWVPLCYGAFKKY